MKSNTNFGGKKYMNNPQNRKRPFEKKVRFNETELAYLEKKIEDSPFNNFQNYARISLLTKEITVVDYSGLRQLNGEINRIGNNINQLAKFAHQFDDISKQDVLNLIETLQEIKDLVSQKFKEELKQKRLV